MIEQTLRVKRYTLEWLTVFVLVYCAAAAYVLRQQQAPSTIELAPIASARSTYSGFTKKGFVVLRLPEATQEKWGTELPATKLDEWLNTLVRNGYRPMLLSDALRRSATGAAYPKRAIVLMFDPGYRQTYEVLGPVFDKYKIPAFWSTDSKSEGRVDMRFLSHHHINVMEKSGLWDVAMKNESGRFSLEKIPAHEWLFTKDLPPFNASGRQNTLGRLNANVNWSGQDLVDRLEVEEPIEGSAYLSERFVQGRSWGVASEDPSRFDLIADPIKRYSTLYWASTTGHPDFRLDINVERVDGEFWIYLRASPKTNAMVRIGFTNDQCLLEQQHGGTTKTIATAMWPRERNLPLVASVSIYGSHISIKNRDDLAISYDALALEPENDGRVEIGVYDKVRGAAQIKDAEMKITLL